MIFAWDPLIANASTDIKDLFVSATKWLVNNKAAAKIVVAPTVAAIGPSLTEALEGAGYILVDDDTTVTSVNLGTLGDLYIHGFGLPDPSRGLRAAIPVINISALDNDDLLLSSIGSATAFEAGQATVEAPSHPAAGGKTGSFSVAEGSYAWNLAGDQLPANATILASFKRRIVPTIASLADLDAMIAGTRTSQTTAATVTALDFNDGSAGNWSVDEAVPGLVGDVWGIKATGKLNVTAAGTYRFALGTDDGGRVQIDLNKNGFDAADTIIQDAGPHAHTVMYGNAIFPSAGVYNFQVIAYDSGGGGSVEVSVATTAGTDKPTIVDLPEEWEVFGATDAISPVQVQGAIDITAYAPSADAEEVTVPMMVLLNGPSDTPPGLVFGGGPFTGFEGTGFFGMSGGNKWAYPEGQTYRSLTLRPINVAGKTDLKLTVAVAATFLDFEDSDYLDIYARPNGPESEAVRLVHFTVPDPSKKYFVDMTHGGISRLSLAFRDVTYDLPVGATDLVIEIRAATTWWNEIVAFDNIRISAGSIASPPINITSITRSGSDINLNWTGGTAPFLVQTKGDITAPWSDLVTTSARTLTVPNLLQAQYFRIVDQTTKTIALFKATLNGANEKPNAIDTPGTGMALVSVEGLTARYWVTYASLRQNASAAHIHGPATANQTANPFGPLTASGTLGTSGAFVGSQSLTQAQADAIATGMAYVNLHSGFAPGGEVRGQLMP